MVSISKVTGMEDNPSLLHSKIEGNKMEEGTSLLLASKSKGTKMVEGVSSIRVEIEGKRCGGGLVPLVGSSSKIRMGEGTALLLCAEIESAGLRYPP